MNNVDKRLYSRAMRDIEEKFNKPLSEVVKDLEYYRTPAQRASEILGITITTYNNYRKKFKCERRKHFKNKACN